MLLRTHEPLCAPSASVYLQGGGNSTDANPIHEIPTIFTSKTLQPTKKQTSRNHKTMTVPPTTIDISSVVFETTILKSGSRVWRTSLTSSANNNNHIFQPSAMTLPITIGQRLQWTNGSWRSYSQDIPSPLLLSLLSNPFPCPSHEHLLQQEFKPSTISRWNRICSPIAQREGFYSHYFLTQKKNGEWLPILDLRRPNKFVKLQKFRMVTLSTIIPALEKGDQFSALDL